MIGKTNLDEFAMGFVKHNIISSNLHSDSYLFFFSSGSSSANIFSSFGPVFNPHGDASSDPSERRVAGGSSGGSAAAVASGMCFAYV